MTLSVKQLRDSLPHSRYSDIEEVGDTILRFTRRANNVPFAVYYVDVSSRLPSTSQDLDEYQDKIVARRYFTGSKSLQWNNYLYFVVSDQTFAVSEKSKELVERDRKYARKFVVKENELQSALSAALPPKKDEPLGASILNTWTNILAAANLDRAILNDESPARRVEMIDAAYGRAAMPVPAASVIPAARKTQPFLKTMELLKFREFPRERKYEFNSVTLICGPNGSGKTSLLEAIELVYCGRTKRNATDKGSYKIAATFSDGTSDTATEARKPSFFRDCNLLWYGQTDQRKDTLYQSFAQFNFLNTDAAVGLAEAEGDLEENLSKLLVGPDASKVWNAIEKTSDKLADRIKELGGRLNQIQLDHGEILRQIQAASALKPESDAVLARLMQSLRASKWDLPIADDPENSVGLLVRDLAEFETIAAQVASLNWAGAPVTLEKLRAYLKDAERRSRDVEEEQRRLQAAYKTESTLRRSIKTNGADLELAKEFLPYLTAEYGGRIDSRQRVERRLAEIRRILLGRDTSQPLTGTSKPSSQTVFEYLQTFNAKRQSVEASLNDRKARFSDFSKLRDESVRLSQQLRDIASRLISFKSDDVCPLCHTAFPPGELMKHMHIGIEKEVEEQAASQLASIRHDEQAMESARAGSRWGEWLKGFCDRTGQPYTTTLADVLSSISALEEEYHKLEIERDGLRKDLMELKATGTTEERYKSLLEEILRLRTHP